MNLSRLTTAAPPGVNLLLVDSVDSTNRWARAIIGRLQGDAVPVTVLLASEQTAGRGRGSRRWQSPPGSGIWGTWFGPVGGAVLASMPMRIGAALCAAIRDLGIEDVGLKWPNDLVCTERADGSTRKLGGVLCRSLSRRGSPVAIAGFGVNLDNPGGELRSRAAGLRERGLAVEEAAVVARLLQAVDEAARDEGAGWRHGQERYSVHRPGDMLRWHDGESTVSGEFLGFDSQGRLRLRIGGEVRVLASGEVD